jgi:GT2 family glycosyltransferase
MNILYIIYTHNREAILDDCLTTLFKNNNVKPDRVLIIDDGSETQLKSKIFNFTLNYSIHTPMDFFSINKNIYYGHAAEFGFRIIKAYDPKYVFFIESDYIFAKNGLDTVIDIFENTEYGKNCVGFAGYDHPDFYNKDYTDGIYIDLIKKDYGIDNLNRKIMYKPFQVQTKYGSKNIEFVSNSCGTMYFNNHKLKLIKKQFPLEYEDWILKSTQKYQNLRQLNDGAMSHGICRLWTKWAALNNIDINKYSALLNIKPSVANHICGAGINGSSLEEKKTFVSSPSWI